MAPPGASPSRSTTDPRRLTEFGVGVSCRDRISLLRLQKETRVGGARIPDEHARILELQKEPVVRTPLVNTHAH